MGAWSQTDKARLSRTRREWWRAHPASLAEHAEKIRRSWIKRRATDSAQCRPESDSALEAQLRRRGITVVEPSIRRLELWPRPYAELMGER